MDREAGQAHSSQIRLRNAAIAAGLCVYEWDLPSAQLTVDDYAGLFTPEAGAMRLNIDSWRQLLHPEDRERTLNYFRDHTGRTNQCLEVEYRFRTCSGRYRWVLDRSRATEWDDQGKPITVAGMLFERSSQHLFAEEDTPPANTVFATLRRAEKEKLAVIDALHDLVTVRYMDSEMRIIWDNTNPNNRPESYASDNERRYCYQDIHGRNEPCTFRCTPKEALLSGTMIKREAALDDGRKFAERSNPVRDDAGDIIGVVFVTVNITRQKQVEEQYNSVYKLFHSFLENSPAPITLINKDGSFDLVNFAWENLVGIHRNDVYGKKYKDILPSEMALQIQARSNDISTKRMPIELEERVNYLRKHYHFHTVAFPIQDTNGDIVSIGSISIDITARKHIEKELEARETELRVKSIELKEANTALRVLLKQKDEELKKLEENIITNIRQLVLPYIYKLRGMNANKAQSVYIDLAESHLNDIITPFLRHITAHHPNMTAKEIHVATLVREGMPTKDISKIMNISMNTVQIHRQNLRKKLGIKNNNVNLRTYLLSLSQLEQKD